MAQVEIYKLRKTTPGEISKRSAFDFMHRGTAPNPAHYTKEWDGQMHGTLPLTIPGRLMLETPKDYHGGSINNGDIAVVNGTPFYFDYLEGSKFIELDTFDGKSAREALHVPYGWFVDIKDARPISYEIANVCHDIGVPCGYLGEHSAGGIFNGNRPFLPGVAGEECLNFLHPQFMKGDEAGEFVESLAELLDADPLKWAFITSYLKENSPITLQDLQYVKELYAPELLLPEVVRPLHKHIPTDADPTEISYLAAKIEGLDAEQRSIFNAVTEIGWQCSDVTEIINLTETLDCFELLPALNETMYGEFRLEADWGACERIYERLLDSEDPAECAFAEHITLLNRAVDAGMYGHHATKEVGGVFTSQGMLTTEGSGEPRTVYRGIQDIPAEFLASLYVAKTVQENEAPVTPNRISEQPQNPITISLADEIVMTPADVAEAHKMAMKYASLVHNAAGTVNDSSHAMKPSVLAEIAGARDAARNKAPEPRDKPAPPKNKSDPDL
jgi:hypothetical protein